MLFFSTIIINIGHIKWGTSWGKVLGSAGTSTVLSTLGINYTRVKVPTIVIRYYTPAQAMFFSFLLMVLSFIFIGLLIYTVNVISGFYMLENLKNLLKYFAFLGIYYIIYMLKFIQGRISYGKQTEALK